MPLFASERPESMKILLIPSLPPGSTLSGSETPGGSLRGIVKGVIAIHELEVPTGEVVLCF